MKVDVVLVDRINTTPDPTYHTTGQAACITCSAWCWLGTETIKAVAAGDLAPLCMECAHAQIPPGWQPAGHLYDKPL